MQLDLVLAAGVLAGMLPFLVILLILVSFAWMRLSPLRRRRARFYPSTFALGLALQFVQVFYRPSVEYTVAAKLVEEAEEDTGGEGEPAQKELARRIRRGQKLDWLVVRAQGTGRGN